VTELLGTGENIGLWKEGLCSPRHHAGAGEQYGPEEERGTAKKKEPALKKYPKKLKPVTPRGGRRGGRTTSKEKDFSQTFKAL